MALPSYAEGRRPAHALLLLERDAAARGFSSLRRCCAAPINARQRRPSAQRGRGTDRRIKRRMAPGKSRRKLLLETMGPLDAQWVVDELHTHGIRAYRKACALPPEIARLAWVPVWLEDAADVPRAKMLLERAFRATPLECRSGEPAHCHGCGYDLRAHSGDGKCPECGYPFRADVSSEKKGTFCPNCHEKLSSRFGQCWKCGYNLTTAGELTFEQGGGI